VTYLLIAIGSALGGMARHAGTLFVTQRLGPNFPWGTLFVNVSGSFAIGIAAAFVAANAKTPAAQATRDFVMIGLLGGFTTFSAFSLQTLQLLRQHAFGLALANAVSSVLVCLAAVWIGYTLTERLTS
jgi:fluoride exporter